MNFQSAALVKRLLASVADAVDEVVVVDNSPLPSELEGALADRLDTVVVHAGGNVGYGPAINRGVALTTGDVLLISNPDVEIAPADLARLVDAVQSSEVGIAAPRFVFADGSLQRSAHRREPGLLATVYELCYPLAATVKRLSPDWHPTFIASSAESADLNVGHVLGALMAIDRTAFEQAGGFDERFFLYREETDLCRRVRDNGMGVVHVGAATAVHHHGGSSAESLPTQVRPEYLESHYRYIAKHRGRGTAAAAWALGVVAAAVWAVTGPHRAWAWRALRWHIAHPGAVLSW